VITEVTDYFWNFEAEYELLAFRGNDPDEKVSLILLVAFLNSFR
jgi:hypothetical protein